MRQALTAILLTGTLVSLSTAPHGDEVGGFTTTTHNKGESVSLVAERLREGTVPSNNSNPRGTDPATPSTPRSEPEKSVLDLCRDAWEKDRQCFGMRDEAEEQPEDSPGIPAFTITDLAQFAPTPASLIAEPSNLGVAGLPANFVVPAQTHTTSGTLFGFAIEVRFTPVEFHFTYGDGETRVASTGGETWEALGLKQFDPTDTTHVYADRGEYPAQVTIHYTAEVDFGGGWFSVAGTLTTDSPPQTVTIYEAHTALVEHTCDENPSGIGCPS